MFVVKTLGVGHHCVNSGMAGCNNAVHGECCIKEIQMSIAPCTPCLHKPKASLCASDFVASKALYVPNLSDF